MLHRIKADVHAGFPTVHAFRVLVVIVERAHALGYVRQKVAITPTDIAYGLGADDPSGAHYIAIYNWLDALENVQLCYVDSGAVFLGHSPLEGRVGPP